MITRLVRPADLGRSFGVHRTLDTVGAALGPLIAFVLLWAIPGLPDASSSSRSPSPSSASRCSSCWCPNCAPDRAAPGRAPAAQCRRSCESAAAPRPAVPWKFLTDPRLRRLAASSAGVLGPVHRRGRLHLPRRCRTDGFADRSGSRCCTSAPTSPTSRWPCRSAGSRTASAGPGSSSGGHVALVAAYVCAGSPVAGAVATVATLLLLGAFYAATDGVLAARRGAGPSPQAVRATGIAAAQTVSPWPDGGVGSFGAPVVARRTGPAPCCTSAECCSSMIPVALVAARPASTRRTREPTGPSQVLLVVVSVVLVAAGVVRRPRRARRLDERAGAGQQPADRHGEVPASRGSCSATAPGRVQRAGRDRSARRPLGSRAVTRPGVRPGLRHRHQATVCLHTRRGVVTTYEATVLDADWDPQRDWPLPGMPEPHPALPETAGWSPTTTFVTGHSYCRRGSPPRP